MNPREDSPTDPETMTPVVPLARLRQAERERDNALEALFSNWMNTFRAWSERDEARAEVARLEAALDAAHSAARDLQFQRDELLSAVEAWSATDWTTLG